MSPFSQVELNEQRHTEYFRTFGARSSRQLNLDPFLNIDLFEMSEPTFPPHPHAGFSAVTYLLPESAGAFQNRDSLGDRSIIGPGDIHWTQAASGMLHEEVPLARGVSCRGFQIFVNLSKENKWQAPAAFHAEKHQLPSIVAGESTMVVIAGNYQNLVSPLGPLASPVNLYDCRVAGSSTLALELAPGFRWFAFGIRGRAQTSDGTVLTEHQLTLFSVGSRKLALSAQSSEFRFLLCGGKPIGEPVVWGGPFAMTTTEEIQEARRRFQTGEMGQLRASF